MFNKEHELWDKKGNLIIKFPDFFHFSVDTTQWVESEDMTEEEKKDNINWKEM